MSATLSGFSTGESPKIEITWGVSWWTDAASTTFPSAVTSNRYLPAPVAAGSLHVQEVGTVTRNEFTCRNFTIEYNLGTIPLKGSGGANAYQETIGAIRGGEESCSISFTLDSQAAGTTTFADWARAETDLCLAYTLSTVDSRAVGLWAPKFCLTGVPVQMGDGGVNRIRVSGMCHTSDTLTTELTRARLILGAA
jgi:hypothetical protein